MLACKAHAGRQGDLLYSRETTSSASVEKETRLSCRVLGRTIPDKDFSKQQVALKYLRKAQRLLGQLNDGASSRSLAAALKRDSLKVLLQFSPETRRVSDRDGCSGLAEIGQTQTA
jgi:hypothetical protein